MKVYILTKGEDSDYHIVAVFSSREKAEESIELFRGEPDYEPSVEEYEVDAIPECPKGLLPFRAIIYLDTGETECIRVGLDNFEEECFLKEDVLVGKKYVHWQGFAKDKQHAIKIVSEKRDQQIAQGDWFKETKR